MKKKPERWAVSDAEIDVARAAAPTQTIQVVTAADLKKVMDASKRPANTVSYDEVREQLRLDDLDDGKAKLNIVRCIRNALVSAMRMGTAPRRDSTGRAGKLAVRHPGRPSSRR